MSECLCEDENMDLDLVFIDIQTNQWMKILICNYIRVESDKGIYLHLIAAQARIRSKEGTMPHSRKETKYVVNVNKKNQYFDL